MILRVLSVGDNCIDDYVELGKKYPGGNALNLAVYVSKYSDIDVDYVGIVGTDDNGRYMLEQIKEQNMETRNVMVKDGITTVTKILIRDGDRVFDDYIEGDQENAVLPYEKIPKPHTMKCIRL